MIILIAPDKFKGSLTAGSVCQAVESGLKRGSQKSDEYVTFPLADGGDGTAEILTHHSGGRMIKVKAHDPLMRQIESGYGLSLDFKTAFIEMADASGLQLLAPAEKNVMNTTTVGTGDLIKDAIDKGATKIIIGIGGSATNDGAIGAASVLGYEFLDEYGNLISPTGGNLIRIKRIQKEKVHPGLRDTTFIAVCDVDNPLTGKNGAAAVYAPQKGASPEEVRQLDLGLNHLAGLLESELGARIANVPGAGGGGGFGGGAIAFFNATLRRGIDLIFEYTGFEEQVRRADVIITGEGKMDKQTLHGKLVAGVAMMAKKYHKPIIGVAGVNQLSSEQEKMLHMEAIFSLTDYSDEQTAMEQAYDLVERIAETEIAPLLRKLDKK
jgi:glycerate 2-kinase